MTCSDNNTAARSFPLHRQFYSWRGRQSKIHNINAHGSECAYHEVSHHWPADAPIPANHNFPVCLSLDKPITEGRCKFYHIYRAETISRPATNSTTNAGYTFDQCHYTTVLLDCKNKVLAAGDGINKSEFPEMENLSKNRGLKIKNTKSFSPARNPSSETQDGWSTGFQLTFAQIKIGHGGCYYLV